MLQKDTTPLNIMINPEHYHIVDFQFITDTRCLRTLHESIDPDLYESPDDAQLKRVDELKELLAQMFSKAGWEGDGDINCIFVPPCLFGGEDGWTEIIYHVKQSNNGMSWLAIPRSMSLSMPKGLFST